MSIPLDRLYHHIEDVAKDICEDDIVIYRFFPHGSKKLENLLQLQLYSTEKIYKNFSIYCNDQEPLEYEFYQRESKTLQKQTKFGDLLDKFNLLSPMNLKYGGKNIYDQGILLHSEKRSVNLELYQNNGYLPAYYWSHAIIARDWFRYAKHVKQKKQVDKIFLVYNRAWAGTREYRLKFSELLIKLNLQNYCKTSINPIEPELGIHYKLHKFSNPIWQPMQVLENYFPSSSAHSHYSADFDLEDYEYTEIEVVLETLFDDDRLHLTEKSLRPIACGQPFILAGTHGSLEYLRSYGFKTFADVWDESYDTIKDPEKRLCAITELMRQIAKWNAPTKKTNMAKAYAIAEYNKQHFFSQEFFNQIIKELRLNLSDALNKLKNTNTSSVWINRRIERSKYPELKKFLTLQEHNDVPDHDKLTKNELINILSCARSYYNCHKKEP